MKNIITLAQERGEFVTGNDGWVCYWPKGAGGLTSEQLRLLAQELDDRNREWEAHVNAYFDSQRSIEP